MSLFQSATTVFTYSTGGNGTSLAVADLNGDGTPDLVLLGAGTPFGQNQSGVVVALANGSGGYSATRYSTNAYPNSLAVADVNGDSRPDIVVAYGETDVNVPNGVDLLLNNGSGGFSNVVSYGAGEFPTAAVVADVNGDGKPDIVAVDGEGTGSYTATLTVLPGNGSGGFGAATFDQLGYGPFSVAVTDVNGDGNPDVVAVDANGGVDVALGNGSGGFSSPVSYSAPAPDDLRTVTVADLNGDGHPDLVVTDITGDVDVLLNNGSGGFSAGTAYAVGGDPVSIAVADVNGDGRPDVVVAVEASDGSGSTVKVLLGNGSGGFSATLSYSYGSTSLQSVAVADLNGDGLPDVVAYDGFHVTALLHAAPETVTGVDTSPGSGTVHAGDVVTFDVALSGDATVSGGTPDLTLNDGGTASYVDEYNVVTNQGTGGHTVLEFATTIADGQQASDLAVTGVALNGAVVQDSSYNEVNLSGAVTNPPGTLAVAGEKVTVTGVTTDPGSGVVGVGATVTFAVALSGLAAVSGGTPDLALNDGGTAGYAGRFDSGDTSDGSAFTTLLFTTTIAGPQEADDLAVTGVSLNGATVADEYDGQAVNLSGAVTNPPGVLTVATPPEITAVATDPASGATVHTGQAVTFTLTTSSPVQVTPGPGGGEPMLSLNDGGTAAYDAAASGPTSLVFTYIAAGGESTPDLKVTGLVANGATLASAGGFEPAASHAAGSEPVSVAVADVNGDTIPDLAVADHDGGVSVLLGTGSGGFAAPVYYDAGSDPLSIAVADVTGDGISDLVVANSGDGTVSVLQGDGSGGFSTAASYTVGGDPDAVAAAQVSSSDATPVLAVTNGSDDTVSVLLGDGAGGLVDGGTYGVGNDPDAVALADVNHDGNPDLVVANSIDGTVSVLLGDGSGNFSDDATYAVGGGPDAVAVADVNGDGNPDLVVANGSDGTVSVLLGDGSGGFSDGGTYAAGNGPQSVAVADVNGDGHPDLVVADFGGGASVLLGDGSGGFSAATSYAAGSNPNSVAVADVTGDGRPDLVVADLGGGVDVLASTPVLDASGLPALPGSDTGIAVVEEVACFCRGTLIRTPRGEVPVERLRVGDAVTTLSGEARPLTWIGLGRSLVTPANPGARPIVVRRGALADGVPSRDLYLTKGHSLLLDGVLIPVEFLVNDRSVAWDDTTQVVEFYHLELARHDVLLAEGAAAESYREDGNRHLFHNADAPRHARPDMAPCAPVLTGGPEVDAVWTKLLARAGGGVAELTDDADLHLLADGVRADGAADGMVRRFRLDRAPFELRIRSRVCNPTRLGMARDPRDLGVALRRLVLRADGAELVLGFDSPLLTEGFNGAEPAEAIRWTTGDGVVPGRVLATFDGPVELELVLGMTTRYARPAEATASEGLTRQPRTGTAG